MIIMLITGIAQVTYWVFDEATFTEEVRRQNIAHYEGGAAAARGMLRAGVSPAEILGTYPYLVIAGDNAEIDLGELKALDEARDRRLLRYGSEGTFFLLVLIGGLAVITKSLRQRGELMRRQENFIAAVSHEFKSPLASLKLSAETLLMRHMEHDNQLRIANRMVQDTERLEVMVTNILDASRVGERRLTLQKEDVPIGEVVNNVIGKVGCRAHVQGVQITPRIADDLRLHTDRAVFATVLRNLLDNAVKSTAASGGGEVEVKLAPAGRGVNLEIRDSGGGFAPGEAKLLFEKFYRPGDELRRNSKGTGLGLYIVKSFVEEGGGKVSAESAGLGEGATFRVWWPAAPGDRS